MTLRIAMWSGPRNLSTTMMYSFAARGDCAAVDEPFYAAYLAQTGLVHPMGDKVIASQQVDEGKVVEALLGPVPAGQRLFYQKHMTHHLLPGWDRGFLRHLTNVFLIRHPARVIASYARKREQPTLADIGFPQQVRLFDEVADHLGYAPPVIDSAAVLADPPVVLSRLCAALGIPFTDRMLAWPAGPKPFDGVWAPHWYGAVHASTGFEGAEGPVPEVDRGLRPVLEAALPIYDKLAKYSL
jgi:hypothetical protein